MEIASKETSGLFVGIHFFVVSFFGLLIIIIQMNSNKRGWAKISELFGYLDRWDYTAVAYAIYYLIETLIRSKTDWGRTLVALFCYGYLMIKFAWRYKRIYAVPVVEKIVVEKSSKELSQSVDSLNDHELLQAYLFYRKHGSILNEKIEILHKEMCNRGLTEPESKNQEIFLESSEFAGSEATMYVSTRIVVIEHWVTGEVTVHRTENILTFFVKSYPSIGVRGVLFGFKFRGKQFNPDAELLVYPSYDNLHGLIQAAVKLGFTVEDLRKPKDRSKQKFKMLGIEMPVSQM